MNNPEQPDLPGQKHASNSKKGKQFESEIEAVNKHYLLKGIVDVVRNAEKWVAFDRLKPGQTADSYFRAAAGRQSGRGGGLAKFGSSAPAQKQFIADNISITPNGWIYKREDSDVDFSGGNDECAYAFDAKESAGSYISMEMLKSHQIHRLRESRRCRTIAGFLIKFTEHRRVFFAPIAFVLEKEEIWLKQTGKRAAHGTASISISELELRGVEILQDKRSALWDWFRYISIRNRN